MKKTFVLLFAVLLSASVSFANYADSPSFVSFVESKTISVSLRGFADAKLTVKLVDNFGNEIVSKTPSKKLANYIFKLDELPEGNYFIEIEDDLRIVMQNVMIVDGAVYVDQIAKSSFKPTIDFIGKKAKVNLLSLGEDVTITFSDPVGSVVFEENLENQPSVNKVYDFMHLPIGNYFMNIKVGDRSYGYVIYR
jgi:hypothetical protein